MILKGRPTLPKSNPPKFFCHSNATFIIDTVAIKWHDTTMPLVVDIVRKLQYQLREELRGMKEARDELDTLREYEARIEALSTRIERAEKRILELVGVLGDKYVEFAGGAGLLRTGQETLNFGSPKEMQRDTPLWIAMREYLRNTSEARVSEIQDFLQILGVPDVGRTAIESAVKRHSDTFKVIKRGHDRWIALRKETDAASTKDSRK